MKNNLPKYIMIIFLVLQSCGSKEVNKLQTKIAELEIENQALKDSIAKIEYQKILDTQILGSFDKPYARVNEEIKLSLQFCNQEFYSTYEMFKIDIQNNKRELLSSSTGGEFEYRFTPKSINDNRLKFLAVFELDSTTIEIPADVGIDVQQ